MAIDLPPSLPPSLENPGYVVDMQRKRGAYIRAVGSFSLQVSGDHYLTFAELEAIFDQAESPSEAILLMNNKTRQKGHLLVQYLYARPINGIIHVLAVQKQVGAIEGDSHITHFFRGWKGDSTPTRSEFVRYQTNANLYSRRTGRDYAVSYEETSQPDTLNLQLSETPDSNRTRWNGALQLGNQGNRFVGRYYLDGALGYNFDRGSQLQLRYQTAIEDWGEVVDGEDYRNAQLAYSYPSRWGLFNIEARRAEYIRVLTTSASSDACSLALFGSVCLIDEPDDPSRPEELDATIDVLAVNAQQLILADTDYRWTLQQRLEAVDSELLSSDGSALQDERYTSLEIGTRYEHLTQLNDKPLNWQISLRVKHGLSSDSGTFGTAPEASGVAIGKRTAKYTTVKPGFSATYTFAEHWDLSISASSQFTSDQIPQQQQWVLGGTSRMHAYLPGVLVGDSGYHAKTAVSRNWALGTLTFNAGLFYEYGAAGFEDARGNDNTGAINLKRHSTLQDAGINASVNIGDNLEISAIAATPLTESNTNKQRTEEQEADFFVVVKASF